MEKIKKLQEDLIDKAMRHHELSAEVVRAFYQYPRHEFVPKNYSLAEAYTDRPLSLYQENGLRSTISQPSFVLYLLDLLKVQEGQKIFEVGTGSGWNAALLSYLVGPSGKVVTMEIIPDLAQKAEAAISRLKIKNILMIEGDAGLGYQQEAPYDRITFTAAAPKLPNFVAEQLKMHGRVLFVKEGRYGSDEVQILEKTPEGFKCLKKVPCHFVAMTGSAIERPSTKRL